MSTFARFHPRLQQQIVNVLGWASLRPVQELAGEAILDGNNCVVLAPTAGGKTESSFFPVISEILAKPKSGVRAIYISPLKALLNNQEERIDQYTKMVGISSFKWHGDVNQASRKSFLNENAEILMTTPESLEAMLVSTKFPSDNVFKFLDFIIIDEIHALASVDRGSQLISILERIKFKSQNDFVRIGLSATVGNPIEILDWMQGSSVRKKTLIDPPKQPSKKQLYIYFDENLPKLITEATKLTNKGKSLIFCDSRSMAETFGTQLSAEGIDSYVHHSSLSLEERERAELKFAEGDRSCIVATSTMELGIDVGDLDRVLQAETPNSVASFLQRIGRTGRRAGSVSNMTFLIQKDENLIQAISLIENARIGWVENVRFSNRMWHLLIQQIMAILLEYGGITPTTLRDIIQKSYPFSGITKTEYEEFILYLIEKDFIFHADGLFSLGLKAEEEFGRRNFMKILSVFQSPVEFKVVTMAERLIGTIQREFVEKLEPGESSFMLGGKPWLLKFIDWSGLRVFVESAPAGFKTKWSGFLPRLLQYEVSRKMREIILSDEEYSYLDQSASDALIDVRSRKRFSIEGKEPLVHHDGQDFILYTYAGGFVNFTLKFALMMECQCEVITSNEEIKIKRNSITVEKFFELLTKFKNPIYWESEEIRNNLAKRFPNYRISKFQDYLPEKFSKDILGQILLDIPNTIRYLEEVLGERNEIKNILKNVGNNRK
ncbi:DEAD/DEAH box helicase [Leptospira bouyouniensis]|uniref:DEAD/DEAH box helicase n=1 Tax=Leptospira bouyouniensis TaxID=2484911 RepID=A0ABY2L3M5_9LEPT|nr:DEAD/DEAH box helicase [Leptospira bouyouniensis]TGK45942.1 DEAD/DEAH box helicase [Leptospira bouyouniensis]